jgi:hypothetical protein
MPSVSKKQHNFMAAVAKNPKFAKKVGIPRSVGEEFLTADKGKKFKEGGTMKHSDMAKDKPMMKKVAAKAVKGHEKAMHGMKKGGMAYSKGGQLSKADGCAVKGKSKGKMIAMKKGGAC